MDVGKSENPIYFITYVYEDSNVDVLRLNKVAIDLPETESDSFFLENSESCSIFFFFLTVMFITWTKTVARWDKYY